MKLILTCCLTFVTFLSQAQCNLNAQFIQIPVCANEDLSFAAYNTALCPDAAYWVYSWGYNSGQSLFVDTLYSPTDSSFAFMPLDIYEILDGDLFIHVSAFDIENDPITTDYFEGMVNEPSPPLELDYFGPLTACNAQTAIGLGGGVPPREVVIDNPPVYFYDEVWELYYPGFDAGEYVLHISDAIGCTLDTIASYFETITENYTCETAQPLENGVPFYYQGVCTFVPIPDIACANENVYDGGWFSFNAENFSNAAITFIPDSLFGEYITYGEFCFQIFESLDGSCTNLDSVYCGCTQGGQINLGEYFSLVPSATYYVLLMTSSDFSYIVVDLSDDFIYNAGCSEINSCNYNPAPHDYEVCLYPGCMDPLACNYDDMALCEDGSCFYPSYVSIQAYFDENADGNWNIYTSNPEEAWSGSGYFTIAETGQIIYPDIMGVINIADLPAGTYTVSFTDPNGYWQLNGDDVIISTPSCELVEIPIESTSGAFAQSSILNEAVMSTLHCNQGTTPVVSIHNLGTMPLNAVLTISYNADLDASAAFGLIPFDEMTSGMTTWFIENQNPGSVANYGFLVLGPGADHVGENYQFDVHLDFFNSDGTLLNSQEWTIESMVTCSFDPNIKQALPIGYRDEHYILAGDEIEYTIQFQNTGNDFAHDVVVVDSLDLTKLDLQSFLPLQGSHPFTTNISELGVVQFIFDNIQLPGVSMNETLSHGFVTFKIRTLDDIVPNESVLNRASIYFDSNEPILTNVYNHTVFNCDWLPSLPDSLDVCEGVLFSPSLDETFVDLFEWYVDGSFFGNESAISVEFPTGLHEVECIASNPLCEVSSVVVMNVVEAPSAQIDWNAQTECIVASPGDSYLWYYGITLLKGQTEQSLCLGEDFTPAGTYYCVVTNAGGCSTQSSLFLYFSVENQDQPLGVFYPNPLINTSTLVISDDAVQIAIHDVLGKLVKTWTPTSKIQEVKRSDFQNGLYNITIYNQNGTGVTIKMIVE